MNTKTIIAGTILAAMLVTGATTYATTTENFTTPIVKEFQGKKGFAKHGPRGHMLEKLTDTEKTQLESMSEEEKREFFETKRAEHKVQREAREIVIDKLLAGETLTTEEETLRAEIIKERAERKTERQKMEEKREAMKTIFEKQKAGEALTDEEQATLDEMKQSRGGKHGKRGGKMWR